jgi:hypothetical protein
MSDLPPSGRPVPEKRPHEPRHWLVTPSTIRRMWIVSAVVLAALTALDLILEKHGDFALEDSFGFGAWYGFVSCVVLILFSKALGAVLKRRDGYYDD